MDALGWLIAYIVGFGLLQLLLYRYFQREDGSADDPSPDTTPRMDPSTAASVDGQRGDADPADGVHCSNCGTYNENAANFAYCRECVSPL